MEYSIEVCEEICRRMSDGETLTDICKGEGMPTRQQVFAWRKKYPAFGEKYDDALEMFAWSLADRLRQITGDALAKKLARMHDTRMSINLVNAYKMESENIRWVISRLCPKILNENGTDELPVFQVVMKEPEKKSKKSA